MVAPKLPAPCPVPRSRYDRVVMAHGSGGRISADLIRSVFAPALRDASAPLEDSATCEPGANGRRIAMTTDAFVVRPLFFPGGDIGRLAVCGTVNDLAVSGAIPRYLAAAFILEEGLLLAEDLEAIVLSMRRACVEAEVELVTGDTKVVDKGKGDGVFITTTGVGTLPPGRHWSVGAARPGDAIIVSGTIGDHGIAILAARGDLELETALESDCAPLTSLVRALCEACPEPSCMRDPTRGGVVGVLHDIAVASGVGIEVIESELPVRREVRAACEILGLDPLYVANEGKVVAVVAGDAADRSLAALQAHPLGRDARIIGRVVAAHPGLVVSRSPMGSERILHVLAGEQLPRIC